MYVEQPVGCKIEGKEDKVYKIVRYTNSDWIRDVETRKSTSRYPFHLKIGTVSWSSSNKQHDVALSTVKAKYIATTSYATQTVCLERILEMMYQKQDTSTMIYFHKYIL